MKESKLKSIARDLYQDVKHSETPSDVYANVMEIVGQQKDYFVDYMGLKNVLKIIIYCWSLIKTGGFELGDKILNEMLFVVFLDSDLEHPIKECDDCDNSGRVPCDYCDGTGDEECGECDGDGDEICDNCGGVGEVSDDEGGMVTCDDCNGDGTLECSNCAGEGRVRCSACGGEGDFQCQTCDGLGEIENDDEYMYNITYLITWNPELKSFIGNDQNIKNGIIETYLLNNYEEDYILTFIDDGEAADLNVREEVYYLIEFSDDPKLMLTGKKMYWSYNMNAIDKFK